MRTNHVTPLSVYFSALVVALLVIPLVGCGTSSTGGTTLAISSSNEKAGNETAGPVELLNVACDPTRELWQDIKERFTKDMGEKTGQQVTHEAIARRIVEPGPRGERRSGSRHCVARNVARYRFDSPRRSVRRGLERSLAGKIVAVLLDNRHGGAQRQPEEHSRLAGHREAWRGNYHAQSENLRQRKAELSSSVGIDRHAWRHGRTGERVCHENVQRSTRRYSMPRRGRRRSRFRRKTSAMCI